MKCGNINFKKGLEMNGMSIGHIHEPEIKNEETKQRKQVKYQPEQSNGSDVDDINKQFLDRMSRLYDED